MADAVVGNQRRVTCLGGRNRGLSRLFIERDGPFRDAVGNAFSLTELTLAERACEPARIFGRVPNAGVPKSALHGPDPSIAGGPAAAKAPRFVLQRGDGRIDHVRDHGARVLGGTCTAAQNALLSRNTGIGSWPPSCDPSGNYVDVTEAETCARQYSKVDHVNRVRAVTDANVHDGVVLPQDAEATIRTAEAVDVDCSVA